MAEPDFTPKRAPETCPATLSPHQSLRETRQQVPALRGALPLRAPQHPVLNWVGIVPGSPASVWVWKVPGPWPASLTARPEEVCVPALAQGAQEGQGLARASFPCPGSSPLPLTSRERGSGTRGAMSNHQLGARANLGPKHPAGGLGGVEGCAPGCSERKAGASPLPVSF